jgi:hypothetical protein
MLGELKLMADVQSFFSIINGREVFDNGQTKRWRCPKCEWWLEWAQLVCSNCGSLRDGVPSPPGGKPE